MGKTYRRGGREGRYRADRHLIVRGVRRNPPDLPKLASALLDIALAEAQAEADAKALHEGSDKNNSRSSKAKTVEVVDAEA